MGSSRLMEFVHAICSKGHKNLLLFGGIQTNLVNDWLQLKPVADPFDDGQSMFRSSLLESLFPHAVQLKVVHQQNAVFHEPAGGCPLVPFGRTPW